MSLHLLVSPLTLQMREPMRGRCPNGVTQQMNGEAWIRTHPLRFVSLPLRDPTLSLLESPLLIRPREFVFMKVLPAGWRHPFQSPRAPSLCWLRAEGAAFRLPGASKEGCHWARWRLSALTSHHVVFFRDSLFHCLKEILIIKSAFTLMHVITIAGALPSFVSLRCPLTSPFSCLSRAS